jgi:glycosyltransferase involved in cell wall biosynthesis
VSGRPTVSVISPAHDNAGEVARFLEAIQRQNVAPESFEVIVCDDHSTDDTAAVVERSGWAKLVRIDGAARGSYVARNAGIEAARGDVFAFVDSDCVPREDWIERGLAALAATGADIVAGHLDVPLGDRPALGTLFEAARYYNQERYAREGYAAGGNLWTRRSTVQRFGAFNDRLTTGGDNEFGRRVSAGGGVVVYGPDVVVRHDARERLLGVAGKEFRLGFQAAQHRYHSDGVLRERDLLCVHARSYMPRSVIAGLDRLEAAGYRPGRGKRLQLLVAQYFLLRLPMLAGNIKGAVVGRGKTLAHRRM